MPDEQRTGRRDLAAVIAAVDAMTPASTEWTPTSVSIVKPANPVTRESPDGAPVWPVPVTTEVQKVLDRSEGGCVTVTGPTAKRLLAAARARSTTAAMWTVNDRPEFMAIGVVLDGLGPCS
ncbi:hypothetical protein ABLG96_00380 [Nakamurella sp. A5-74]|uniref:Uncharacterized protein n=1 Tax=Nakamurella sp. A5-74 TaxID=3158264 RepID=A0AAU8DPD4_9ACTN